MPTTEQRILDAPDRREMVELAKDLARLQSFTTQETPVAQYRARHLGQRGLAIDQQEVSLGASSASRGCRDREAGGR